MTNEEHTIRMRNGVGKRSRGVFRGAGPIVMLGLWAVHCASDDADGAPARSNVECKADPDCAMLGRNYLCRDQVCVASSVGDASADGNASRDSRGPEDADRPDAPDGHSPLDCESLGNQLQALEAPQSCSTDLDCNLIGGVFVPREDETAAAKLVSLLESQCHHITDCELDGPSYRGRCRSGRCVKVPFQCGLYFFSQDGGTCGPPPGEPLALTSPVDAGSQAWDGFTTALCMVTECWPGTFEYDIDHGATRTVEVVPGDASACQLVITERDGDGWGQRKVCPAPGSPPVGSLVDPDYFVTVDPEECEVTAL